MPPPGPHTSERRHGVVLPVKRIAVAKSRLAGLGDEVRRELVAAFALDTAEAALTASSVGAVLVLTDDAVLARAAVGLGAQAVPDAHAHDLNASLSQGARELERRHLGLSPVALCADLPAIRPTDLDQVLSAAPSDGAGFVADAAGVGTTLYCAPAPDAFAPRFGPDSRAAHHACGATDLSPQAPASVRRDVDTPPDLRAAIDLGVGERTSWVVTRFGLLDLIGRD